MYSQAGLLLALKLCTAIQVQLAGGLKIQDLGSTRKNVFCHEMEALYCHTTTTMSQGTLQSNLQSKTQTEAREMKNKVSFKTSRDQNGKNRPNSKDNTFIAAGLPYHKNCHTGSDQRSITSTIASSRCFKGRV